MIEIGILKNFDSGTYKAGVQLAGSLTTYFDDISVAKNIPSSALVIGNYVILAIPGGNPKDACVIATWPQGSPGGGTFLDLSDTPSSYSGQKKRIVQVNDAQSGLEFGIEELLLARLSRPWWVQDFGTMDRWTLESVGSGSNPVLDYLRCDLATGATIDSEERLYNIGTQGLIPNYAPWKPNQLLFGRLQWTTTPRTNSTVLFGAWDFAVSKPPSLTAKHVGWKVLDGAIWATNADGTTEKATDTGIGYDYNWHLHDLLIIGRSGGTIEYYIDGALKAIHTENIPVYTNSYVYASIKNAVAENRQISVTILFGKL
jgi:hypothetical protein